MANLVVQVGSRTAQGVRPNNQDALLVDPNLHLYLVADGMGGQENGERASNLAVEIIPKIIQDRLQAQEEPDKAIQKAITEANEAIIQAGRSQPEGRRMGTTAVLALQQQNRVVVANLGDSRAYLIRGKEVRQLTVDHSVAQALVSSGALTPEEARVSPLQHVLHKFLGCVNLYDGADLFPFTAEPGDRLLLATDGLTNFIDGEDLRDGLQQFPHPQAWVDHLVQTALDRGSRDNVTCIVVAFEAV